HTGHLMVQELRIPIACKRKKTKEHWHLERCDIVQKFLHDAYVIDWLGHDELRSGFALQAESMKLSRIVRCPRLDSRGTEKGRRLSERLPTRIESMVQSAYQPEQANGIGVVDGRGIWKVAHLGRITRNDDEIPYPKLMRCKQICDEAQKVLVTGGHMHQG